MAFRSLVSTNNWPRNMMKMMSIRGNPRYATSTFPKMKPNRASSSAEFEDHPDTKPRVVKGQFMPVYVAIGMICLSVGIGIHTLTQQLARSPNVSVKKSRRETIPEVVEPEKVIENTEKFINKSWFRKVAHVQDFDPKEVMPNPSRGDTYASDGRRAVTLKDAGVDPKASS